MKKIFFLFLFAAISLISLQSCTKAKQDFASDNPATTTFDNAAERYVSASEETMFMDDTKLDLFMKECSVFPKEVLREYLCNPSTKTQDEKYRHLMTFVPSIRSDEGVVETIIQYNSKKRIIDANAQVVALTISQLGMSTAGQNISTDFYKSSQNVINSTDVYLAGWALNTSNQNGNQIASQDNFIELLGEPTAITEYSGGEFEVEAAIIYNGPSRDFVFYNAITQAVDTVFISTGEVMIYGADSEYGTLFLNLTLNDETIGSATYNTATLAGPIPGTDSGSQVQIYLSGGVWPVVVQ